MLPPLGTHMRRFLAPIVLDGSVYEKIDGIKDKKRSLLPLDYQPFAILPYIKIFTSERSCYAIK